MAKVFYQAVVTLIHELGKNVGFASRKDEQACLDDMVQGQNILANFTNGQFEKWNKEFDNLYPDLDTREDPGYSTYNQFIREKELVYTDMMNRANMSKIMDYTIGDECNLMGRLKKHPDILVDLNLKPVSF